MAALRKCPKCDERFRKRSTFLAHWRKVHDPASSDWPTPTKSKGGK